MGDDHSGPVSTWRLERAATYAELAEREALAKIAADAHEAFAVPDAQEEWTGLPAAIRTTNEVRAAERSH